MKKKLPKYQLAGENPCGPGTTWDEITKRCIPLQSFIGPQEDTYGVDLISNIFNNRKPMKTTGNEKLQGKMDTIGLSEDEKALGQGFNKDSDGVYRKKEITIDKNNLVYSAGFQALNVGLDAARLIGGNLNDFKNSAEEEEKLLKARYKTANYNSYEGGLNNVPVYAKYGVDMQDEEEYQMMAVGGDVSIVDYLAEQGQDYDFKSRKQLASEIGIKNYTGTAEQNTYILKFIKANPVSDINQENQKPAKYTVAQPNDPLMVGSKEYNDKWAEMARIGNKGKAPTQTTKKSQLIKPPVNAPDPAKVVPVKAATKDFQGFENERQFYFAQKAAIANNGRFVLTDKATNKTFYGTYDKKTNKFDVAGFEVLTGKNKNQDIDPNLSVAEMDAMKNVDTYKVTPVSFYEMKANKNIYGAPGFNLGNTDIAYHTTYKGPDDMTRDKKYNNKNNEDNYASYGCINCKKPNIENLTKFVGGQPLNALIMNSNKFYKENQDNIKVNTPNTYNTLNFKKGGSTSKNDKAIAAAVLNGESINGVKLTAKQKKHFQYVLDGKITLAGHIEDAKKADTYAEGGPVKSKLDFNMPQSNMAVNTYQQPNINLNLPQIQQYNGGLYPSIQVDPYGKGITQSMYGQQRINNNLSVNGNISVPIYGDGSRKPQYQAGLTYEFEYGGENNIKMLLDNEDLDQMQNGGIPDRYKNKGFTKVGVKRKSSRPGKKWMVLAKKGDSYKIVHGGDSSMQDYSQHKDKQRKKNFWNRMGTTNDPFSARYWHKKFGTWAEGGDVMEDKEMFDYEEFKNGGKNVMVDGKPMYKRADGKIVKRGLWSNVYLSKKQEGGELKEVDETMMQPNAELEQGEVFQQESGDIQKVAETEPTHEEGGSMQADVKRVLEDTSDKRKDKISKALKITPNEAYEIVGFKPKGSVSHSKLFELANEKNDAEIKRKEKLLSQNLDLIKYNNGGIYAQASAEENIKVLQTTKQKEDIFNDIFDHQENIKQQEAMLNEQKQMQYGGVPKYQQPEPVVPSKLSSPLGLSGGLGNVLGYIGASERTPVDLEQLDRTPLRVHELNPLPTLLENQGAFNAAISQLPNSGVGYANIANLAGQKYKVNNQVLGQYENTNKQRYDQIDQYNDQAQYQLDGTNLQLRDQFVNRVLTGKEKQRLQKQEYANSFFKAVDERNAFDRNANLALQLSPYFNAQGEFNSNDLNIMAKYTAATGNTFKYDVDKNGNTYQTMYDKNGKPVPNSRILKQSKDTT